MRAACDGSREARSRLFERHWPAAWRRAVTITGRRALAEDVAQDAFERAFRALPDFDGRAPFGAWLARIVTNRAIDALRAERRLTDLDEADAPVTDWLDGTDDDLALRAMVARLGAERRVVIVLRYWLDESPAEIAEALGLPIGTVHSRLARALKDLRTMLKEDRDVS